jgi:SAM-dependent methyltransferase
VYAEILVGMGADVVALDANPKMVALARARLGDQVQVIQASLEAPLDFFDTESFDVVLAPLVMDYICDWRAAFSEFQRVLKPGGILVFSIEHPMMKYFDHQAETNYFQVEQVSYTWRGFGSPVQVPSYRRSLGDVFNPLIEVGFFLEKVLEPLPTAAFKDNDPQDYEKLTREPGFMCVRARRR